MNVKLELANEPQATDHLLGNPAQATPPGQGVKHRA